LEIYSTENLLVKTLSTLKLANEENFNQV